MWGEGGVGGRERKRENKRKAERSGQNGRVGPKDIGRGGSRGSSAIPMGILFNELLGSKYSYAKK